MSVKKTKTLRSMFSKFPVLSIHPINKDDVVADKPIISFGLKKAEAILEQIESIKKFVESEGKES